MWHLEGNGDDEATTTYSQGNVLETHGFSDVIIVLRSY